MIHDNLISVFLYPTTKVEGFTKLLIKTLEEIETAKIRQQMIIDQCNELEHVLNHAIESSNQRLKLFNKKEESNYAHHSRNLTRIEH